jgi:hypothetical protein
VVEGWVAGRVLDSRLMGCSAEDGGCWGMEVAASLEAEGGKRTSL